MILLNLLMLRWSYSLLHGGFVGHGSKAGSTQKFLVATTHDILELNAIILECDKHKHD